MNYWLMKTEPSTFSIDDLQEQPDKTEHWDGVRNYRARNIMRDEMSLGDLAFFYHSNCPEPGIVGIVEIVKEGYPDHTAWDPKSDYYDPKSDPEDPRWFMVDVQFVCKFKNTISLARLKEQAALEGMGLLQKGNRLSVMPVSKEQWDYILQMN